ncbi:hypothetical protein RU97_GL001075 [Enterococcus canis]|uniref:Lipoprotein n=2 Tax=Enterococcus canis TaxID=214095 RepID=A0A1L8RIG5_9ENTE|nr:hypothetical protein RU97_GL001075 [Enterococcus canis]
MQKEGNGMKKLCQVLSLGLLVLLVGCQSNNEQTAGENESKNVSIVQVYDGGTVQNQGSYVLVDGTLEIDKSLMNLANPNTDPSEVNDEEYQKQAEEIIKSDFPDEKIDTDNLFAQYKRTVKNAKAVMTKEKVELVGDNFKTEFERLPDNENRLKDHFGVEYSLNNE